MYKGVRGMGWEDASVENEQARTENKAAQRTLNRKVHATSTMLCTSDNFCQNSRINRSVSDYYTTEDMTSPFRVTKAFAATEVNNAVA